MCRKLSLCKYQVYQRERFRKYFNDLFVFLLHCNRFCMSYFDYRQRYGESLVRTPCYEACSTINDSQRLLEKRLASVDTEVSPPRELLTNHAARNTRAGFPLLDAVLLNQEPALRYNSFV